MLNVSQIIDLAKIKTIVNYKSEKNILLIKLIKEYCENNNAILEYEDDINFIFTIYSTQPYKDGNNLCNILFTKGMFNYIQLGTRIKNTELNISINNQRIIFFKLLFLPSSIVYNKLDIVNNSSRKVLYLPSIVNLLLEQNNNCQLSNLLSGLPIDTNLLKIFLEQNKNKLKNYNEQINTQSVKNDIIKELLPFIKTLNIILLDYYAINENIKNFNNTLQIIFQSNIIIEIKNKLTEILNLLNIKGDIIIQKDHTYIIDDFRLQKTLIYVSIYNKKYKSFNKINIINCFNELSYNLIPVLKNNIIIPHPYILMRYLIINMIYIYLYANINHISYNETLQNISILLKKIDNINIENYKFIGLYKNEELDLNLHDVYRPAMDMEKYNKLRSI